MINENQLVNRLLLLNNQKQIANSIIQCIESKYSYLEFDLDDKEKVLQIIKDNNFFTIFINLDNLKYDILNFISSIKDIREIPIVIIVDKNNKNLLPKSLYQEVYLFIERPLDCILLSMVIKNIYEIYKLKEERDILFQSLIESNKKIEEGNKYLKEIENKVEQLLSLRYV